MSKLYKVKTVGAVIDGQPLGTVIEVSEKQAKHLESLGYVEIVTQERAKVKEKEKPVKKESAPKKPASKTKAKSADTKK